MDNDAVSVERVIASTPEKVFALLADASKHALIDGSGTVQGTRGDTPQRLTLGATFGMSMRAGVPYAMVNTVVEFEENRRIAWQAKPAGLFGMVIGGRIWRYELEPVGGGVRVRETWDISKDKQKLVLRLGTLPRRTKQNMEKTLERIEALVTASSEEP